MISGIMDFISFEGSYASAMLTLWAALPAVVLLFTGIRLVMVQQKKVS